MAAPSYTEDLTDISLADNGVTGYASINHLGGGGGALGSGADFSMQGTSAVDRPVTANNRGAVFDNGAGINVTANDVHVFQWIFVATPGLVATLQNEGVAVLIGSGVGALVRFHVDGSDQYGAAGRVGKCYAVRYVTSALATAPYRTLTGTPVSPPSVFGASINVTGAVKGSNLGIDATRYGTGAYLTAGELLSAGDGSDNPCSFEGFSVQNDAVANRWGILTKVGTVYELQGKFVIGQTLSKVATLCRFKDSDRNIVIVDTPHSLTNFTSIEVDHNSTRCELTNINITGLGTNNRGQFFTSSNFPTLIITGGTWVGIGNVSFGANTTVSGLTLRQTDVLSTGDAVMDSCVVESSRNPIGAVWIPDSIAFSYLSNFTFSNNPKAIRINDAGTYTFDGHQFSGNTVDVSFIGPGDCIINPINGCNITQAGCEATNPSGTITVNAISTTINITEVPFGLEGRAKRGSLSLYHEPSIATGTFTYAYTGFSGKPVVITVGGVTNTGVAYERNTITLNETGANVSIPFNAIINPSYIS
jgi:hypothetical protein